jgi:heme-degrading monooxygenase HmoA
VIVREFKVKAGCENDFELVFGSGGLWCELLQRYSDGYLDTEVQIVSVEERRYMVRDFWKSHWDFELFRVRQQHEVELFRDWLASQDMVEQETLLGSFCTDEPGDDAGLVEA